MTDEQAEDFSTQQILSTLRSFVPASAGARDHPELALKGASRFPHVLRELCFQTLGPPALTPYREFGNSPELAETLRKRFTYYGSDKANHNYHVIYGEILSRLGVDSPLRILEIGLGTTDSNIVSHMDPRFTTGASVRAFRDTVPEGRIFGADIDRLCLFSEERISTAWVDQMEPDTFPEMIRQLGEGGGFDLVIDDGLHCPAANLNTLVFALGFLNPGGWIVIEDIWRGHECWDVVYNLLPAASFNRYIFTFETTKRVFALEKIRQCPVDSA